VDLSANLRLRLSGSLSIRSRFRHGYSHSATDSGVREKTASGGYREWLMMPASLINKFGTVEIQEIDEEPLWGQAR
jgi:hypothetical protein